MRPHPYLRAYMSGIVVPTLFLLAIMVVFGYHQYYFEVPNQFVIPLPGRPLERAIIFPMAVVPNVWGVWNMLLLALRSRVQLTVGVHGALLPLFLMPAGVALARALDVFAMRSKVVLLYGSSERVIADCICSIALFRRHATLMFHRGVDLEDTYGMLRGTGKVMRHLRFQQLSELDRPELRAYLRQARKQSGLKRMRRTSSDDVVTRVKRSSPTRRPL